MVSEEYRRTVQRVGDVHSYTKGFNGDLNKYRVKRFVEGFEGVERGRVLEIGAGEGPVTRELKKHFESVVVVEPVKRYCHILNEKVGNIEIHNLFFEDFRAEPFDCIVASGVLEHVADTKAFLENVKRHLNPGAQFMLTVPNAGSLHRHIGKAMGVIKTLEELGDQDKRVGHYRYYTLQTLRQDLEAGGLEVLRMSGIFLKPFPSVQMSVLYPMQYYDALDYVGRSLTNFCAEIFATTR